MQIPISGNHFDKVDEATPDDFSTYVYNSYAAGTDLYGLTNHSTETGTIHYVRLYTRIGLTPLAVKGVIKIGGTIYHGTQHTAGLWQTFSDQWNKNPQTGQAWTWGNIDNLQAGILLSVNGTCTQVYVEVNYTPSP
jgi:hypothetical protein